MEARACEILDEPLKDEEKPTSLRSLLTKPVVISVANYGMIGLLEMMAGVLIPLVWSTPIELGGLSMSPASIGLWMAGYGSLNGLYQFVIFPFIVERFGPRRVFIVSIASFIPMYLLLFFENLTLRYASGFASMTIFLIVLQLSSMAIADMGFGKFKSFATSILTDVLICVPIRRLGIHVRILLRAKQAVSRRHQWPCADDGFDSTNSGTSCCGIAVCLFPKQQRLGWKLYLRSVDCPRVCWTVHRHTAPKEYVETCGKVYLKEEGSCFCTILVWSE
jgi:hypothetical protein